MTNHLWPKRLFLLDVSRGLASLSVVLWHWQHFAFVDHSLPESFDRAQQPFYFVLKMFFETGDSGVAYFFLLSGFIFFWIYKSSIEQKKIGFTRFWVQRISRLYPLHFVTLIIVTLLQGMYVAKSGDTFVYQNYDVYHFILNLFFASKWGLDAGWSFNGPVWSVSVEILLYFIFFLVALRRLGSPLFCLIIAAVGFVINGFLHHPVFEGLSLFFLGGFVFQMTYCVSDGYQKWKPIIYSSAIICWVLVLTHFYLFSFQGILDSAGILGKIFVKGFPHFILFPLTVSSLALIEVDRNNLLRSIAWIGDITYSSYLLHFPLQLTFGLLIVHGIMPPDLNLKPGFLLLFFAILIPASYLTYIGFERPVQNFIRNRYKTYQMSKNTP